MSEHHFKYKDIYFSEGMFRTAMAMAEQSEREHETLTKQLEIAMGALDKIANDYHATSSEDEDAARQALAEIEKLNG